MLVALVSEDCPEVTPADPELPHPHNGGINWQLSTGLILSVVVVEFLDGSTGGLFSLFQKIFNLIRFRIQGFDTPSEGLIVAQVSPSPSLANSTLSKLILLELSTDFEHSESPSDSAISPNEDVSQLSRGIQSEPASTPRTISSGLRASDPFCLDSLSFSLLNLINLSEGKADADNDRGNGNEVLKKLCLPFCPSGLEESDNSRCNFLDSGMERLQSSDPETDGLSCPAGVFPSATAFTLIHPTPYLLGKFNTALPNTLSISLFLSLQFDPLDTPNLNRKSSSLLPYFSILSVLAQINFQDLYNHANYLFCILRLLPPALRAFTSTAQELKRPN